MASTKSNVVEVAEQKTKINSIADLGLLEKGEIQELYLPEVDATVYITLPDAYRRGRFEDAVYQKRYPVSTLKMRTCALGLCDEKGKLLFPDINAHDHIVKALGSLNSGVIERIALEVTNMAKIDDEIIEDEVKNSQSGQI